MFSLRDYPGIKTPTGVLIVVLSFCLNAESAIVTSISNNPWSSGATWDSGTSPSPTDDIIVLHAVALDVNVTIASPGRLTIRAGASLKGNKNITISAGAFFVNDGTLDCKKFTNSGNARNNGTFRTSGNIDNNGIFTNTGSVECQNFINNGGNLYGPGGSIVTENNVINNAGGYISGQYLCKKDGMSDPLISNSGTIDPETVSSCADPLPIELVYFEAVPGLNCIIIYWTTASEINNDFFTIEKTRDGIDYEFVANVKGIGQRKKITDYKLIDDDPYDGLTLYRLKQTDFDGVEWHSHLVSVFYTVIPDDEPLQLYPNPSRGNFIVNYANGYASDKELLITIRDYSGRVFWSQSFTSTSEQFVPVINLQNSIPAGTYMITGVMDEEVFNERMVVLGE